MQNSMKQFTNSMPPDFQKISSELVDSLEFPEKTEGFF